ncbi:MAG TPA: hypothetical protein VHN77_04910 [Phycisphaerales bacterium]|nr:hypothetical protein [Phycisphaerales bacterium]
MTTIPANVSTTSTLSDRHDRVATLWDHASWGPIMMGAVCAIGLQFIFTVLGIALGASAGEVTTGSDGTAGRTMGMVAGLWWLITGTLSLAVGGFVFGRLAGLPRSLPLTLKAMTMWGVVALFGFLVVWSGAGMLSQAVSPIGAMSPSAIGTPTSVGARTTPDSNGAMTSASMAADNAIARGSVAMEEARRATRTASWWSVVGLLMGLVVSVAAATAAAPATVRVAVSLR